MGERQVSSGRKAKSARAQRREAERREAAAVRRLEARARVLTYEPGELDQAVGQQPRLLDVALMSRYAARHGVQRMPRTAASRGESGSDTDPRR